MFEDTEKKILMKSSLSLESYMLASVAYL